jgi:hypothetical protein
MLCKPLLLKPMAMRLPEHRNKMMLKMNQKMTFLKDILND